MKRGIFFIIAVLFVLTGCSSTPDPNKGWSVNDTGERRKAIPSIPEASVIYHPESSNLMFMEVDMRRVDLSVFPESLGAYVEMDLYVNNVEFFGTPREFRFELSSSGLFDKRYDWNIDPAQLKNGWNYLQFKYTDGIIGIDANPSNCAPDWKRVNYWRIYCLPVPGTLEFSYKNVNLVIPPAQ